MRNYRTVIHEVEDERTCTCCMLAVTWLLYTTWHFNNCIDNVRVLVKQGHKNWLHYTVFADLDIRFVSSNVWLAQFYTHNTVLNLFVTGNASPEVTRNKTCSPYYNTISTFIFNIYIERMVHCVVTNTHLTFWPLWLSTIMCKVFSKACSLERFIGNPPITYNWHNDRWLMYQFYSYSVINHTPEFDLLIFTHFDIFHRQTSGQCRHLQHSISYHCAVLNPCLCFMYTLKTTASSFIIDIILYSILTEKKLYIMRKRN